MTDKKITVELEQEVPSPAPPPPELPKTTYKLPDPKVFMVKLADLIIGKERGRKLFTGLQELALSIHKHGLIHPIVVAPVSDQPGKYHLIAGERRYRSSVLAGFAEIPATLRENVSESKMVEMELEENLHRSDLEWEEECALLARIQELKKKEDPTWGVQQTANLTNRSVGDVSTKVNLHKKLKERPDIAKRLKDVPYTAAAKIINQIEETEKIERLAAQGQIVLSTDIKHGDCRQLIGQLPPNSIDLLLTDPPYGIESLEVTRTQKQTGAVRSGRALMSETHNLDIATVAEMLRELSREFHRVLKPGAHFYMFCDFQHLGTFIEALKPLEFCPPILIWDRGKGTTPAYGYNYMSRTEAIIFGVKPPKSRRLNEPMFNVIECPEVPRNLRIFPTEKPLPLLQTLINNSTSPGHVVFDQFCGSGSTLEAARNTGRSGVGFEINQHSFMLAQKRLLGEQANVGTTT